MTAFSDYLENELIDHVLRNQAYSPPATVYVALFTSNAGLEANAPSTEVTGGAYARQSMAFDAAANGATANTADVTFPTASASWGTITSVAVVDHLTNATWGTNVNVLFWADLTASKAVGLGDVFRFLAGDFDVVLD